MMWSTQSKTVSRRKTSTLPSHYSSRHYVILLIRTWWIYQYSKDFNNPLIVKITFYHLYTLSLCKVYNIFTHFHTTLKWKSFSTLAKSLKKLIFTRTLSNTNEYWKGVRKHFRVKKCRAHKSQKLTFGFLASNKIRSRRATLCWDFLFIYIKQNSHTNTIQKDALQVVGGERAPPAVNAKKIIFKKRDVRSQRYIEFILFYVIFRYIIIESGSFFYHYKREIS